MNRYGFTFTIAIIIDADDWPILLPPHRLKMNNSPIGSAILEVHEPRLT